MLGLVPRLVYRVGSAWTRAVWSGAEEHQPVVLGEVGEVPAVEGEQWQPALDAAGGDPAVVERPGPPPSLGRGRDLPQTLATLKPAERIVVSSSHSSSPPRRAPPHRLVSAHVHSSPAVAKTMLMSLAAT
jgi:hypothetical protein